MPTPYTIGPYDSGALPVHLRLKLTMRHAPDEAVLGWGASISDAEVEWGFGSIGLEDRVARGGLDWTRALMAVEKLCARCSQANTLAFAQAVESMAGLLVPPRAAYLRMVLVETERAASHLLNLAAMLHELDMPDAGASLADMRERLVQGMAEWTGARLQPGLIVFGGLSRNLDEAGGRALMLSVRHVERAMRAHAGRLLNTTAIAGRLAGLGVITGPEALAGGLRGPVARASGLAVDVRSGYPTGAYEDEGVTIVVQRNGDAFSRFAVRLLEALESLRILEQALDDLPPGQLRARGSADLRAGSGIGRVEGPAGEVFCWIRGEPEGLRALHLSGGSFPTLGVIPGLLRGVRMDDLRLLILSLDLCLACDER